MLRRAVFAFTAVAHLVLLDQIVKEIAVRWWQSHPVEVAWFFNLVYVENRGCAWGLLQGHTWALAVFSALVLALLVWKHDAAFPPGKTGLVASFLLYAGIVGNLIDRLARGFVVDMFDFHWGEHHFPVFNVADSYITVSVALLVAVTACAGGDGKK